MKEKLAQCLPLLLIAALFLGAAAARADIYVQCPEDPTGERKIVCKHLGSGDGYVKMADGKILYIFGFSEMTETPANQVMEEARLAAAFPGPKIVVDEGQELYLTLSNVGFMKRPDLFDPHTVHWHGFPETGAIFDGLPESAISINVGASATYYYKVNEPGTYMYHCHAEATEHMQMGMLGSLYVRPKQNADGNLYAYNDGDGSTRYDVEKSLQLSSFDPEFHDANENVWPLPFALMEDKYPLMNGRGYPDTVSKGALPALPEDVNGGLVSQFEDSLIEATAGQKILLRISNLNVTRSYTLASLGIPMRVVGRDAKLYRSPTGQDLYYNTNSISLGSGETADVILDTTGIAPGTYFLYASELNYLSNYNEDFGGMMTEIRIN